MYAENFKTYVLVLLFLRGMVRSGRLEVLLRHIFSLIREVKPNWAVQQHRYVL